MKAMWVGCKMVYKKMGCKMTRCKEMVVSYKEMRCMEGKWTLRCMVVGCKEMTKMGCCMMVGHRMMRCMRPVDMGMMNKEMR